MTNRKLIELPADGQAHHTSIEWWYFNGHLAEVKRAGAGRVAGGKTGMASAAPRQFAFMDAFFRADAARSLIPSLKNPIPNSPYAYFAHAALSDLAKQKSYRSIEPVCITSRDSFTRPLFFVDYVNPLGLARGYENSEIAEVAPGSFRVKTGLFDLALVAEKKPLFEGGDGRITVCGKQSYYYSFTKLLADGYVKIGTEWIPVAGMAWMDHQWANVSWNRDKWTWFSLQLDDDTDLMCVEYDDGKRKDYLVDIMDPRGRAEHYKEMRIAPTGDEWESPATGAKYPVAWRIEIPAKKAMFMVRAPLRDQEMVTGAIHYWEGPVEVQGTMNGKKVTGRGFMELVGYPAGRGLMNGKKRTLWQRIGFRGR